MGPSFSAFPSDVTANNVVNDCSYSVTTIFFGQSRTKQRALNRHLLLLFQQPRLKTNKQKIGVRYYEAVNVKNKNRNKKTKHKEGQSGRKGRKRQ